jgi:hypothetical protein
MVPTALLLSFIPIKLLAYIWWSYKGFFFLKLHFNYPKLRAIVYGLIRLLMGLMLGMALVYMALLIVDPRNLVLSGIITYLLVYLPVRWLEWGLLEFIMSPKARSFDGFIFGVNKNSRRWRLGGLLLCAVMDVPIIILTKGAGLGNIAMC